jgi:hypothetical protein
MMETQLSPPPPTNSSSQTAGQVLLVPYGLLLGAINREPDPLLARMAFLSRGVTKTRDPRLETKRASTSIMPTYYRILHRQTIQY